MLESMESNPFRVRMAVIGVLVLALAACGKSQVYREPGTTRPPPAAGRSVPKPGQTVTVKRGDTIYRLALGNGISPLDLAVWNGIAPPYTIYPGQRLKLYPGDGGSAESRGRDAGELAQHGTDSGALGTKDDDRIHG